MTMKAVKIDERLRDRAKELGFKSPNQYFLYLMAKDMSPTSIDSKKFEDNVLDLLQQLSKQVNDLDHKYSTILEDMTLGLRLSEKQSAYLDRKIQEDIEKANKDKK